jgi:hypothetical protein
LVKGFNIIAPIVCFVHIVMTEARHIICWTLIIILIAYPFMSLMGANSTQNFHAFGQATDAMNDNLIIDGIECVGAEQFAFHIMLN